MSEKIEGEGGTGKKIELGIEMVNSGTIIDPNVDTHLLNSQNDKL